MPYDRQYYLRTREKRAAQMRRWRYGDQIERLWEQQEGRCANQGCRRELGTGKNGFQVDHDHRCCPGGNQPTCGRCTRGLLCPACNSTLRWSATPEVLTGLADYLNAHPLKPKDQMRFSL